MYDPEENIRRLKDNYDKQKASGKPIHYIIERIGNRNGIHFINFRAKIGDTSVKGTMFTSKIPEGLQVGDTVIQKKKEIVLVKEAITGDM